MRATDAARLAIAGSRCQKPRPMPPTPPPRPAALLGPRPLERHASRVPGDKSISHRALMLGALAVGETRGRGAARRRGRARHGAGDARDGRDDRARCAMARWHIHGVGVGGLLQPETALDMGNSGTSTRLLMGLVASHPITATFTGDASLSKRPMERVIEPLSLMGADFTASPGGRLPLMLRGACPAVPIEYRLPVASAQVKSAILLAGLNTPGITRVIEPVPTRDHSERMLRGFGAELDRRGGRRRADHLDPRRGRARARRRSSCRAIPRRRPSRWSRRCSCRARRSSSATSASTRPAPACSRCCAMMGADIAYRDERIVGGEPVADLRRPPLGADRHRGAARASRRA